MPCGPGGPCGPVGPCGPLGPLGPCGPAGPVAPSAPLQARMNEHSSSAATPRVERSIRDSSCCVGGCRREYNVATRSACCLVRLFLGDANGTDGARVVFCAVDRARGDFNVGLVLDDEELAAFEIG